MNQRILISLLLMVCMGLPVQAQDLDAFKVRIQAAFSATDKQQQIRNLFHLAGADDEIVQMYDQRILPMLARREPSTIDFEDLPPDFNATYVQKGYEYSPNLELLGYVVLDGKTRAPYGAHDGAYYFTGMTRELVNADAPPEVTLQVNIFGFSAPPIRYAGTCTIMQSNGKTRDYPLEDNGLGNNTMMVNAVRVESCTVQKLSGNGDLTLRIVEDGKTVFEANQAEAGVPITFKR